MMIKTAIIGASGFVGGYLLNSYRRDFPDCMGTSFANPREDLTPFDIRNPDISQLKLDEGGYGAVILASAKPQIAYCENEKKSALEVNVTGMKKLVDQLNKLSFQKCIFY